MTGTPSITLPSSSPLSHSPDIGEAVVGKDESKERRRKWQRRYTLFWLIRKLTQLMKSAVRIGDYCLANVLMNIVGPTLILFVLGICFILVNTFWNVFYPWLGSLRYIHAAFVAFVTMQVLFNYAMCVYTSNSSKIEKYARVVRQLAAATPDFTYPETPQQLEQAKRDYLTTIAARRAQQQQSVNYYPWTLLQPTEWGFCFHTNQPKPPRSHYESFTKSLVLNLDHYCPWMYNSIGYFNYRYFVTFLIYVSVGMMYGFALSIRPFFNLNGGLFREQMALIHNNSAQQQNPLDADKFRYVPKPYQETSVIFTFMICISVGIAVLGLNAFHFYLISTAQTTIEFHSNIRSSTGRTRYYAYDLGLRRNWQQVFGKSIIKNILIPTTKEPEFLPVPLSDRTAVAVANTDNDISHGSHQQVDESKNFIDNTTFHLLEEGNMDVKST